ncbi:hypothetical protein CEXT_150191, partial [Caerostris extrusa]
DAQKLFRINKHLSRAKYRPAPFSLHPVVHYVMLFDKPFPRVTTCFPLRLRAARPKWLVLLIEDIHPTPPPDSINRPQTSAKLHPSLWRKNLSTISSGMNLR